MSNYIDVTSITDKLIAQLASGGDERIQTWMIRVNDEIDSLAESMDVDPDNIVRIGSDGNDDNTPLHPKIAEYARSYYCMMAAEESAGMTRNDVPDNDIYFYKARWYADKVKALRGQITPEMFTRGDVDLTANEVVGQAGMMWRS